jgi:hypothetical protein
MPSAVCAAPEGLIGCFRCTPAAGHTRPVLQPVGSTGRPRSARTRQPAGAAPPYLRLPVISVISKCSMESSVPIRSMLRRMLSAPLSLPVATTMDAFRASASAASISARVIMKEFFNGIPGSERWVCIQDNAVAAMEHSDPGYGWFGGAALSGLRGVGAAGSTTSNTAPPSGLFAAEARPPCTSVMARTMDSPRPVPPGPLEAVRA